MKKKTIILGHRGYNARFPENTLMSFRKALECGADGFECDIQKTSDGHFIVFHDAAADRLTGVCGSINSMTLADIKQLRVDGEEIPTLVEMLDEFKDCYINIELKGDAIIEKDCPEIAAIVRQYLPFERVMISSFNRSLLPYFKKQGFMIGLLIGWSYRKHGVWGVGKEVLRLKPNFLNLPTSVFGFYMEIYLRMFLLILSWCGIGVVWWTVNSKHEFLRTFQNASYIITDEVEEIRSLLERYQ